MDRSNLLPANELEPIHHEPGQQTLPLDLPIPRQHRKLAANFLPRAALDDPNTTLHHRDRVPAARPQVAHPLAYAAKMILQFLDVAGGPVTPFDIAIDCLPRYSTGLVDSIIGDLYASELIDLTEAGATLTDAGRKAVRS